MTICPGKHEVGALSGKWGASSVVILMELEELTRLKVKTIGAAVQRAGMDWHFLPIKDVSVPDQHFEDLSTSSDHALRCALMDGK